MLSLIAVMAAAAATEQKPSIFFMLADDLGWNNLGWNNPDVRTPELDALRKEGVGFMNHYVYKYCSPTRSSFMTGRFPLHVQEQNGPYWSTATGPPLNMTFLPQKLKQAGYRTHHAGKWHLGAASHRQLPVERGFDTSFGFLDGMEDHLNHRMTGCLMNGSAIQHFPTNDSGTDWTCWGNADPLDSCIDYACYKNCPAAITHDLWKNSAPANHTAYDMKFSQDMYEDEILSVIHDHPAAEAPLFVYMPFQVTHSPIQPPPRLVESYTNQSWFLGVRKVFAFVTAMDESVGRIVQAIKAKGYGSGSAAAAEHAAGAEFDPHLWSNSLLIFTADNGGPLETMSNFPMRGGKFSDFHGGARAASFASGGLIPVARRGTTLNAYIHVADWLPTFCHLAGVDSTDTRAAAAGLPALDGVNIWPQVSGANLSDAHTELPLSSQALLDTQTGYKIMVGKQRYNMWSPSHGWPPDYDCVDRARDAPLECGTPTTVGSKWGCLFNVHADPSERVDLASHPSSAATLKEMQARFLAMTKDVWHNCDPPSTCQTAEPDQYCLHTKQACGSVYCPIFP